ncbi:hypothetical protein R0135_14025 [Congregibacter variabilis]|uniref:Uncharacterized protein n=1 Tax=Congregibacter variabilis TaxID=3081200 RepID=A0ABZ0I2Y7_9GAMM|nr:hypothetical protein R0135_14025 [Congregibacter sp. IMCC43200]
MYKTLPILFFSAVCATDLFAAANCKHSSSWQCQGHTGLSPQASQTGLGISGGGQTPSSVGNQPLGSVTSGSQPMVALIPASLIPPQPQAPQVPKPQPQAIPQPIPQQTPQPMQVPPQVPPQVPGQVPQPQPQAIPQAIPQQVPQPMQVPSQVPGQVPQPQPQAIPQAIPQQVPQPMQVPSQVPGQVPQPQPQAIPQAIPQQVPQPMQVPSQVPGQVPQPQPQAIPQAIPQQIPQVQPQPVKVQQQVSQTLPNPQQLSKPSVTSQVPTGATNLTPVKVTHQQGGRVPPKPQVAVIPNKPPQTAIGQKPPTSPSHVVVTQPQPQIHTTLSGEILMGEIVEPGIQNKEVELYRSEDAEEALYSDIIPMDKTGFHLTVFGTRPPVY